MSSAASAGSSWTVYHGDELGSGTAIGVGSVDTTHAAWRSRPLDGQLYGEPLVLDGTVYVATQDDTVYALSASTGRVVWSRHLATPVRASALPCGDIAPLVGITGTPVIDAARDELFAVADVWKDARAVHYLFGLNARTGAVELRQDVEPQGSTGSALLQRTGLTLDAGRVIFGFGGNYGDCAAYRGTVEAVPEAGGRASVFLVDRASDEREGAVWMGGAAPVVDAQGHVWVSVGNGSVTTPGHAYDDSDSLVELTSTMRLVSFFAPTTWEQDNAADLDMSMAPAILASGQVVVAGKARIVYVLNGHHLGGIGGDEVQMNSACGDDIDGGVAVVGQRVYVPCLSGPLSVRITTNPASVVEQWAAHAGGEPPIVTANRVWTVGSDGVLYGLSTTTGAVVQQATIGVPANHFVTPSVADGLLLVTNADQVIAFAAR